jgi:hypothetical protein
MNEKESGEVKGLSAEQEQKFARIIDKWATVANSTEPIDRDAAACAIAGIYAHLDMPPPIIIYCLSPLQLALMPGIVSALRSSDSLTLQSQLTLQLQSHLGETFGAQLASQLWLQVESQLLSNPQSSQFMGEQWSSSLDFSAQLDDERARISLQPPLCNKLIDSELNRRHVLELWRLSTNCTFSTQLRERLIDIYRDAFPADVRHLSQSNNWDFTLCKSGSFAQREFANEFFGCAADPKFIDWVKAATSIPAYAAYQKVCFVCDRPTSQHFDQCGRLHKNGGPALQYADGFLAYAWHGRLIDWNRSYILEASSTITVSEIEQEEDVSVRWALVDCFGQERFSIEFGAQIIDRNTDLQRGQECILYRKEVEGGEPIVMVAVEDTTPSPQGWLSNEILRVPPTIPTALKALEWHRENNLKEYRGKVEKLTPIQEHECASIIDRWATVHKSTEPIDKDAVAHAIARVYAHLHVPPPTVIYCSSPLQLALMPGILHELKSPDLVTLRSQLTSQLESHFGDTLGAKLASQLWLQVESQLLANRQLSHDIGEDWSPTEFSDQLDIEWHRTLGPALNLCCERLDSEVHGSLISDLDRLSANHPLISKLLNRVLRVYKEAFPTHSSDLRQPFTWDFTLQKIEYFARCELAHKLFSWNPDSKFIDWVQVATAVPAYAAYEKVCFVRDRPASQYFDQLGRLHNSDGPALQYADGFLVYAQHGVLIDLSSS